MARTPKKKTPISAGESAGEPTEFIAVEPLPTSDSAANDEAEFFKRSGDTGEPGIFLPLTPRRGYLRINDPGGTTSVTVFAFIVLVILLLILVIVGAFVSERVWITEIAKFLGQALLAVVGAIVGSSAATPRKRK